MHELQQEYRTCQGLVLFLRLSDGSLLPLDLLEDYVITMCTDTSLENAPMELARTATQER